MLLRYLVGGGDIKPFFSMQRKGDKLVLNNPGGIIKIYGKRYALLKYT